MERYKVVLYGSHNTIRELLKKACYQDCDDYYLEDDSHSKSIVNSDKSCTFDLFNTNCIAGGPIEKHRDFDDNWLKQADGFLIIYSVADSSSFLSLERYYDRIVRARTDIDEKGEKKPVLLVACDCSDIYREITREDGFLLARKLGCKFVQIDVEDNVKIDKLFYDLYDRINMKTDQTPNIKKTKKIDKFLKIFRF
ncbi:uncharacterized protein BX664DRAFT_332107, partial [Halteromyces radiatus]|uniref:uncharacterized protein n=1 Tax=Halteromyces radiatus TaxID=101107 RepID=UPI00221E41AE